jgi:HPt (histidine-containing phosphotransfer) domain-containing protein
MVGIAHRLAGAAANLGFEQLHDVALAFERSAETAGARPDSALLESTCRAAVGAVADLLSAWPQRTAATPQGP